VDLTHSEADEQFRQEFRAWLDENLPAEWRTEEFWATKTSDEAFDLRREWERNKALAGQIPLLVVMVAYTVGGLLLLFSS